MKTVTTKEYKELLQAWMTWMNSYYALIGPRQDVITLLHRTADILARGEMK